jgi:hypothetical protein
VDKRVGRFHERVGFTVWDDGITVCSCKRKIGLRWLDERRLVDKIFNVCGPVYVFSDWMDRHAIKIIMMIVVLMLLLILLIYLDLSLRVIVENVFVSAF